VSCEHHYFLDAYWPGVPAKYQRDDPLSMVHTCVLDDVRAAPDGRTLEEVAAIYDLTRERIRQIEERALRKLSHRVSPEKIRELIG